MVRTRVCEMLNIPHPVVQGTVSRGTAALAAAVSEAGGLGTTESLGPAEELRKQLRAIRRLTNKPFSVNLPLREGEKRAREAIQVAIAEDARIQEKKLEKALKKL